jgi:hypothetical protein
MARPPPHGPVVQRVGVTDLLLARHQAGLSATQKAQIWIRDGASSPGRHARQSDDMHRLADRSAVLARGRLPLAQWGLLSSVA